MRSSFEFLISSVADGSPQLVLLKKEVNHYRRNALAISTQKTYKSQYDAYMRFCIKFDFMPVPISQKHLLMYTVFLSRSLKASSIAGYLNVVRLIHVSLGYENPLENNFELSYLKRGILREIGSPPKQAMPMTTDMLLKLRAVLDFSKQKDLTFWGICLTSFYGMLRKSSILPETLKPKDRNNALLDKDVKFCDDYVVLSFRHSKTNQFGRKIHKIPYCRNSNQVLCPFRAILSVKCISEKSQNDLFFSYCTERIIYNWTGPVFFKSFKSYCAKAGLPYADLTPHSMRRGGATLGHLKHLSPIAIQARGDWATDCYKKYIHLDDDVMLEAARLMVS